MKTSTYPVNVHLAAMQSAHRDATEAKLGRRVGLVGFAGFVALLAAPLVLIGYFVAMAWGLLP